MVLHWFFGGSLVVLWSFNGSSVVLQLFYKDSPVVLWWFFVVLRFFCAYSSCFVGYMWFLSDWIRC